MINSIVFTPNYVAKEIISKVAPSVEDKLRQFTGEGGVGSKSLMRDEVKDIAFYSHNENCSGCQTNFVSDGEYLGATISAPVSLKSFIVEAADSVTKAEEGTTLIAYTHHSNLDGKTPDIEGEEMNLVEGRRDGLTCDQKLREYHVGWAGSASGGISAGLENLAYFANPGFGLIASGIQQVVLTPALQDCVDDKEGYYVHFYAPPEPEQKKTKSKETLSNETVTDALAGISEQVDKLTSQEGPIAESLGNIKDEFDNFAGQAKQNDLLQASLEMLPPSKGTIIGNEIFYIWFKETMMPSGLKTEGMSVTKDGNHTVVKDYANGDLLIDGKEVINNKKEIVGNIIQDNRIPAEVVPVKVTNIGAPQTDEIVFELSATGNVTVLESQVLSCIQEAVKAQVGITFSGNELTQVFGKLNNINTEIYQQVTAQDNKIFLEGTGPRYQGGATSTFVIDGYWKSRLNIDDTQSIDSGLFIGMSFEYGSIVLNEETGEIVVWLRQHKESVLSNKEVSGLKAKLSSVTDPDSGCEQPAIELEASAFANDELGQQRVDNFNTSMKHLGPFTQFTTDGKIYEFYSVRDPATGECKDFFRVIDKETGKVLTDSEIVGGITQDADGTLTFKTADGKTHTLDFDAENGVPKLSYNGGPAETLRTAQGPNGSFWYDPNTGRWYPENGMQIPLNQAFKDQGSSYKVDGNGNVTGTPGNPMTFNIGQGAQGGFNIPSLPETMSGLVLFIMAFLTMAFVITRRKRFEITK